LTTPLLGEKGSQLVAQEKMPREESNTNLPTADQIVGKYLQAIGGAEAAGRVSTRIQSGTLTVGSEHFPVKVLAKAPDKRVTIVHFDGGDSVTGINGEEGWLSAPGGALKDMTPSEADAARLDAELFFPASLKPMFKELHVEHKVQIDGREAYVLTATREPLPPVQLFFDQQSGFLVRVLRFVETPLGRNPTAIDYAYYREEGGVRTPFRWTVARPSGSFTIQIEEMQQNAPIGEDKFAKPAPPPQSKPQAGR
jgi:hypothetical protein